MPSSRERLKGIIGRGHDLTLMGRLPSHLLGSYVTHALHTARIRYDERVLYNDTETLMVRLLSHLLGSYVAHFPHTARISNNERVLHVQ